VRNAQASSTFNPFSSDGSGKEKFRLESIAPEEYKEKEWFKNIAKSEDPVSELFKKTDNLNSAMGKNVQVPGEDATPEQRKAFYKATGVPESIKGYEVTPTEWAVEDKPFAEKLKEFKPDTVVNPLKEEAIAAGISKQAWEKLEKRWDKLTVDQLKANAAAGKQMDIDFDSHMTKKYGDQKMAVMDRGAKMLSQFSDPQDKAVLAKLPNDALAAFAGILSNVYKATTREDTFNTGVGNTSSQAQTGNTTRQELFKMAEKLSKMNPMTPEYESLAKKVQAGYKGLPEDALAKPLSLM
jgi:hypothetical protein